MHFARGDREGFLIDKARGQALSHVYTYSVSRRRHLAVSESYSTNDGDDNYITYTAICVHVHY